MDKKITVNSFSKYRLERAKQEYEVSKLLYKENQPDLVEIYLNEKEKKA